MFFHFVPLTCRFAAPSPVGRGNSRSIMREKVDILPIQGRSQELIDPGREKPENSEKRTERKKSEVRKREKKSKK
jgi:hypothetical protein